MRVYMVGAYRPKKAKPDAIKIGVARDANKRLLTIQTGNHLECRIIATWNFGSLAKAFDVEAKAHHVFRRYVLQGEWFEPRTDRYLGFFNSMLAAERSHAIKTHEAFVEGALDGRLLAEEPWLRELLKP